MYDSAGKANKLHFFECLIEGYCGHFTSLEANHASEFPVGAQACAETRCIALPLTTPILCAGFRGAARNVPKSARLAGIGRSGRGTRDELESEMNSE
jgi:hypothetical protein